MALTGHLAMSFCTVQVWACFLVCYVVFVALALVCCVFFCVWFGSSLRLAVSFIYPTYHMSQN